MIDLNQFYFELLFSQRDLKKNKVIMKDRDNDSPIIPFSLIENTKIDFVDLYTYEELEDASEFDFSSYDIKLIKMHAGLGTSVERKDIIERFDNRSDLSAKGADLFFRYNGKDLSAAEIHCLFAKEKNKLGKYKSYKIQNLVNDETIVQIEKICSSYDTYEPIVQQKMPTLRNGQLSNERKAPCGHGFVGIHELFDAYHNYKNEIVCIGNGEDLNSSVDDKILKLMIDKKIPILMITTTKTSADKKGGQLAWNNKEACIQIIEKAQAQQAGQLEYFEQLGLREGDFPGYFNTNIVLMNKALIHKVLNDIDPSNDATLLFKNFAPDLIKNIKIQDNKEFTQLESALGSVILNLDKYLRSKSKPVLGILNLDSKSAREKFFLPIKKRGDYDELLRSYSLDFKDQKLIKK